MKKSLSMIITGLFFISIFFLNIRYFYSSFSPFNQFIGIFGFIQLLEGVFYIRESYNNIYLALIAIASAAILILSYIQASLSYYMIYFYLIAGIYILISIWFVYKFHEKMKKFRIVDPYNKSLQINPKDVNVWNNKGNALISIKEYDKAIKSYNTALKLNPKDVTALFHKGIALAELKKYHEAIESYNQALKIDPNNSKIWNNKGYIFTKLDKYQESIDCSNKAIELDPKFSIAWCNKGTALTELKKYEEALECYNKAVELDSKDIKAWHYKGMALQKLGREQEAIEAYEHALEIDPDFEPAKKKIKKNSIFGI